MPADVPHRAPRRESGVQPGPPPRRESDVRPGTILQGGRAKAYRPLPAERRREILLEGLDAYDRGDFFLAHELLEPAWMGASDPAERNLYQGLIKLAAAFVHDARGNPAGVEKNLRGARDRLAEAVPAGAAAGLDVLAILREIDAVPAVSRTEPVPLARLAID